MAQKILDMSDTLSTTTVLINGYVIKLSLNICICTHKLVLFSTFFLQWIVWLMERFIAIKVLRISNC